MSTAWLAAVGGAYALVLVAATWHARRTTRSAEDYMLAGSSLGVLVGALTFGATLFSTFTLMGMPDFFRTHGVVAWIFLGVTDAAIALVILWYAVPLRRRAARLGFQGLAGLLVEAYGTGAAGRLYFAGIFLFLIPYVAVQVRGIGILLGAAYPETLPDWGWSLAIVVTLLVYSEVGGLKAIVYSDALQGLVLLVATWVVARGCLAHFGGVAALFESVARTEPGLLSAPGPHGLFTFQFLLASMLAILVLPITQPQLATRLVIMRDARSARGMAVTVGVFSMLVILPTLAIGLYGAVAHAGADTADFLAAVLIAEQAPAVAATVAVGLVAAAMSTADSQLFALGGELRSLMRGDPAAVMRRTRVAIVLFAAAAFAFAVVSSDQLVLLARVSFAGTAILAPLVLFAVLDERGPPRAVIPLTALALAAFLATLAGVLPEAVGGVRADLLIFGVLALACAAIAVTRRAAAARA